jgi:hypothetical protein
MTAIVMACLTLRVVSGTSDWMERSTSKTSQARAMMMAAKRNPGACPSGLLESSR